LIASATFSVMPGQKREARLRADIPGIHVLAATKNVDGRDKPGHDEWRDR
jgi:hypothetical protein